MSHTRSSMPAAAQAVDSTRDARQAKAEQPSGALPPTQFAERLKQALRTVRRWLTDRLSVL